MTHTRRAVLGAGAALAGTALLPTAAAAPKKDRPGGGKGGGGGGGDGTLTGYVTSAVGSAERCRLPTPVAADLGVGDGEQVRLVTADGPALFTATVHDEPEVWVSPAGRDRLLAKGKRFDVAVDPTVVHPTYTLSEAASAGELVERFVDGAAPVAVLAPHGGRIEYGTDGQARRVADALGAPVWYAAGWWPGGGAYRRWHVTSTALHPDSFPALGALGEGYECAVAFHGWSEAHVGVGGGAPLALREAIRDAVAEAVGGTFEVRLATDPARDGTDPTNVVNRVTTGGGVQLEQPYAARTTYGDAIADAVAGVLAEWFA